MKVEKEELVYTMRVIKIMGGCSVVLKGLGFGDFYFFFNSWKYLNQNIWFKNSVSYR